MRFFQVHAMKNGRLAAMVQREVPMDPSEMHKASKEAVDAARQAATAIGGCDDIILHEEESPKFLWAERRYL